MHAKILRATLVLFFSFLFYHQNVFSFSIITKIDNKPANTPVNPDYLRGSVFVKLSARDFTIATGQKMNFFQRIYFKVIQRQVKKDLKKNPDLLITNYYDQKNGKFKFSILRFVIASFIGPLGVLLAYISHQGKDGLTKKDRTISAWLGFVFFVIWFGSIFVF